MTGNSAWPKLLLMIGGLALAISPFADRFSVPFAIIDSSPVEDAWVVVVEETSDRNVDTAKIASDGAFWRGLEARGVSWRFYDIDSENAKSYVQEAKKTGLPSLIILNAKGKVLKSCLLPKSTLEIDLIVKEVIRK